ncbi:MAG: hypothetical protein KGZ42_09835 [Melioribacter sp.]|nr:hypothetical protein [Melioribacter sp.]
METEKKLSDYMGRTLLLTQLKFLKRDYELKCEEEIIASINYPKWYGSDFEIAWGNKKWFVYRPSFWKNAIEIKEASKQLPFASYKKKGFKSGGIVSLPMGEELKIFFKFFKGSYGIQNSAEECLVLIKDKFSWNDRTEFYIQKRSELLDKYPWMILLAWYVSSQQRSGGAVT